MMWPRAVAGIFMALSVLILCALAGAAMGFVAAQAIKLTVGE